jgi:GT2 family glycosyltransferase
MKSLWGKAILNPPTFSIIIPALNEEKHLPACLRSIQNLDYPKDRYQVILVDNGSTDRTCDIGRQFGVTLLRDDRLTVSGLRNLGAKNAQSEILAFVDADCTISFDWLNAASAHSGTPRLAAWGAPAAPPPEATWVQKTWYLVRKKTEGVQRVDWLESMNLFVKKDLFVQVGGFNEKLTTCEDVDLCYRLKKLGAIVADDRILVLHYGEAATVREFIRKELWRGIGNFAGVASHGISLAELPSLAVPVYFGLALPLAAALAVFFHTPSAVIGLAVMALAPGLLALARIRGRAGGAAEMLQLLLLLQVYFGVRTLSVVKAFSRRRKRS